jgi:hypothetical protein
MRDDAKGGDLKAVAPAHSGHRAAEHVVQPPLIPGYPTKRSVPHWAPRLYKLLDVISTGGTTLLKNR